MSGSDSADAGKAEPRRVVLTLNQQQLELLDRTLAKGVAASRADLIRLALREYAAAHAGDVR